RRVDAEELQIPADVAVTPVRRDLTGRVERSDDDRVADVEALDALPDGGDGAGHLVADHLRRPHAVIHRSVGDVEVGAADAAVGDVEAHLARAGRDELAVADPERLPALVEDGLRSHRTSAHTQS